MACDNSNDAKVRIALGFRDHIVQVWKFDAKGALCNTFSMKLGATVPKALAFEYPSKDIAVFGLYNGHMCVFSTQYVLG